MKSYLKILMFCLSSVAFISCDRITKHLAKEHLMNSEVKYYFHDTFRLMYVENTGAALNLGAKIPQPYNLWLLSILPLILLLVMLIYVFRKLNKLSVSVVFFLSLIFAGGIGNIIDRVFFDRHVTDFMNIGIGTIETGIFNVADMCVTAGAIGMFFFLSFKKKEADKLS